MKELRRNTLSDCLKCLSLRGVKQGERKCRLNWKIGTVEAARHEGGSRKYPLTNIDRVTFREGGVNLAGYATGTVKVTPEGGEERDLGFGAWRLEPCPDEQPQPEEEDTKTTTS
jgi:hypothetical protein